MLRTNLSRLVVAVGLAALATQVVHAGLYLDVQLDPSSRQAGDSAYVANVTPTHEQFTLDVYALITDPNPSTSVDEYKSLAASFLVANPTLTGDVSFGAYSSNTGASGSQQGVQKLTPYGALVLGGTTATDGTSGDWFIPLSSSNPLGGSAGVVVPGVGVDYLLGTINVNFAMHNGVAASLPTQSTTAAFVSMTPTKLGIAKPDQWIDNTGTYTTVYGSASNIGSFTNLITNGATATPLSAGAITATPGVNGPTALNFVFTSSTTGSNPAALSAALAITGPTTLLGGTTTSLTGAVTNSGTSPADPLNWGSTAPGTVSLSPSSGSGLTGSTTVGGTLLATTGQFGPWATTVTFTGTDATTSAVLPSVAKTLNFSIIGKGTTPTGDGLGTPGGPYGNLMSTRAAWLLVPASPGSPRPWEAAPLVRHRSDNGHHPGRYAWNFVHRHFRAVAQPVELPKRPIAALACRNSSATW